MMDQQLVTIDRKDALATFACDDPAATFAPILAPVRAAIDAFQPDISTVKGRKEIASFARLVVDSKTLLEGIGKELADEVKKQPKLIDASRRYVKDTLDAWRDEARKPLTDWENAEKQRVSNHEDAIALLSGRGDGFSSSHDLAMALACVNEFEVGPSCEEFEAAYARAKESAVIRLTAAIAAAEKREAEQAELERLRKEKAERDARERDERIAREAAENARLEAERKAREDIERRESAALAEKKAIEAKALAAQEEATRAAREAERREIELRRHAQEAEQRAAETEARIKREAEEAQAREEDDRRRREADQEHRALVNRAALQAFVENGLVEGSAKIAITLIAKGMIPNISIHY
jgi:colicin import membrane protein